MGKVRSDDSATGLAEIASPVSEITPRDRRRASRCVKCPLCRRARQKQGGLAFWIVKRIERRVCPWCRAYEKVYGHPPHKGA